MSISAGALDSVREFLNEVVRTGQAQEFPFWDSDSGRWALSHWASVQQDVLEKLQVLPIPDISFVWAVETEDETLRARIFITPLADREGVLITIDYI